jgi:glutathione S-transferase
MSLKLYYHPLSSFCQKVLIALYENEIRFEPKLVDFSNPESAAEFRRVWPIGKMPVLRDETKDRTIPESSIIIEYLAQNYPGRTPLIPADAELALETRLRDRFFDLSIQLPMQKIVGDRLRPAERKDPQGVEEATAQLQTAYGVLERDLARRTWAVGDLFTMADCAAAPALFYADRVVPFGDEHRNTAAYLARLKERASYARALREAAPYLASFPQ